MHVDSGPDRAEASAPTRVLVVDDHEILASSLQAVIDGEPDLQCVGTAGTLRLARALIGTTAPDVLLLDHRLPDGDGVDAIVELRALRPSLAVVVLTATTADSVLVAAIEAGAAGFISKSGSLSELTSAVRSAATGEAVISPDLLVRLLPRLRRNGRGHHQDLTEREREVLELLSEGLSNAAIAQRLVVSVYTVRNHVSNLSTKLGAHSKLEVLSIAVRDGLLPGN